MKDIGDVVDSESDQDFSCFEPKSPRKTVHFADSKGLALASMHFFPTENCSKCPKYRAMVDESTRGRAEDQTTALVRDEHGKCNVHRFLNFKPLQPNETLQEILMKYNVCLEEMFCDCGGISGKIQVRNLAFEKEVFVRYTIDSWVTCEEKHARFICGSSTGAMDAFEFHILLSEASRDKKMELAICYRVCGREFWDNNYGDNYRLILM